MIIIGMILLSVDHIHIRRQFRYTVCHLSYSDGTAYLNYYAIVTTCSIICAIVILYAKSRLYNDMANLVS